MALAQSGCGGRANDVGSKAESPRPFLAPARNPKVPVEVSYPIIKDEDSTLMSPTKRMVDVKLNMKVPPAVLREIALEVKSKESRQYERTFIFVYLPDKVPGVENEPWATTHFNPTLEVKILGLTREAEESLSKLPIRFAGKKVGAWLIEMQNVSNLSLISEDSGTIKLAEILPSGTRFDSEMVELPSARGRRFKKVKGDEIYEVDPEGNLRMYDGFEPGAFAASPPL